MTNFHDYIILGGGPAGVQLAYFLEKSNRDYLVLERGAHAGAFFDVYPRHRKLISINKRFTGSNDPEFNMRHDWNSLISDDYGLLFRDYDEQFFPSAENLVRYINDFVEKNGVKVQYDTTIAQISREEGLYRLTDTNGADHFCRVLVIATGLAEAVRPPIDGIEFAECYSRVSVNPDDFTNKRVLIIGKGNSAFETADHLVGNAALIHLASPESIDMAWKTHYVGHLRAVNNNFLDTYQLKSQNAVLDADIRHIRRDGDMLKVSFEYAHAEGEIEEIAYDRIIYCAGFRFDRSLFSETCEPQTTACKKYPAISWEYESVNLPNLYFAGTLTHSLDYRKATSGFIHGFRYNCRALHRILAQKYHDSSWPSDRLAAEPAVLTDAVLGRVNRSSALWQQPGYMMDLFAMDGGGALHFTEMPKGYANEFGGSRFKSYFTASLEYGDPIVGDPFNVERVHRLNIEDARRSQFLHPVVRHYVGGQCVSEHHVLEDLEAIWVEQEHIAPLKMFFERAFSGKAPMKEMQDAAMADMH